MQKQHVTANVVGIVKFPNTIKELTQYAEEWLTQLKNEGMITDLKYVCLN